MVRVDRVLIAKIVYRGPGLSGRTENIRWIADRTPRELVLSGAPNATSRGPVFAESGNDRVFLFHMRMNGIDIGGFGLQLMLSTQPGMLRGTPEKRREILLGADAVVFVADSRRPRKDANLAAWNELLDDMAELGMQQEETPILLQLNKRDLVDAMPIDEMQSDLRTAEIAPPVIEAVAATGQGVFETLKAAVKPAVLAGRKRLVQA